MTAPPQIQRFREQLLADPSWFAQKLDLFSRRALFVRLAADAYAQASFLDDRMLTPATQGSWLGLDEMSAALAGAVPARPLHFIFHAGHVGSTLVSRLLENAGGVLSIREPLPLRTLAEVHDDLGGHASLVSVEGFTQMVREQIVLWSRGYPDTRVVVLKATSTASRVAPAILREAPAARILYLSLRLEPYLATLLAGLNSPIDLRGHAAERTRRLLRNGYEPIVPLHAMSLGELAAMSWTVEQLTAAAIAQQAQARMLAVDFDQLLTDPALEIRRIAAHFELDAPSAYFAQLPSDPNWGRYAKAPEHAYSPLDRAQILADSRSGNAAEIRKGLDWFDAMARRYSALGGL